MDTWQATHRTYSAGREALADRFIFGVLYDVKEKRLTWRTCPSVRLSVTVSATKLFVCQNVHKTRYRNY